VRNTLLCFIRQRELVISYRRLEQHIGHHQKVVPKTSVRNYHYSLRESSEERSSQPHSFAFTKQKICKYFIFLAVFISPAFSKLGFDVPGSITQLGGRHKVKCFSIFIVLQHFLHIKVECTLVQALRLCTGRTVHRGSRGIVLLFLYHDTRRCCGVSITPRPLFSPRKDPVLIVQKAGWAPGPVWTGAENLASTGIRCPDRPSRSQSLYRLSYPVHNFLHIGLL